jgi:hypothetical protein
VPGPRLPYQADEQSISSLSDNHSNSFQLAVRVADKPGTILTHGVGTGLQDLLTSAPTVASAVHPAHFGLLDKFYAWAGDAIARAIAIPPRYHTYSLSAAQVTWSFQSTKGPWGLARHAQTWSSKNAGMV